MSLKTDIDALALYSELAVLEEIYPSFRQWYVDRVIPGLADGSRLLVADVNEEGVAGVAIAKRDSAERKLCTLWRHPRVGRENTTRILLTAATSWLGTQRPLFTVPADRTGRLRPVLNELGIGVGVPLGDLYRPGVEELLFNADRMAP